MNKFMCKPKQILYRDLLTVAIRENGEALIPCVTDNIRSEYIQGMDDMNKFYSGNILIRKTVFDKLLQAQKILKRKHPSLILHITYGYRNLAVQSKKFQEQLIRIAKIRYWDDPLMLYEEVHKYVAVPSVAGHPTGGAVDVQIQSLDFGSTIYDFSSECNFFSTTISSEQKKNRILLRNIMMTVGFAPFDGEWWHFSYGDREWAYYYGKPFAYYAQL